MTRSVGGNIVLGQICLFGGLLVCVVMRPHGLVANDGISYYGIFRHTVGPYALALMGMAFWTRRALHLAAPLSPAPAYLRGMATWMAAMSVGVVLTPYSLNIVFDWAHTLLGAAVFVLQLVLGLRMLSWSGGDAWMTAFLVAQFCSGVFAAVFVLPKQGFLIQGQLAFQLAFGALLLRTARLLVPQELAPATT